MNDNYPWGLSVLGTTTSTIGTLAQTNEMLRTISLIITIIGAIISFIVIPLLNWHRNAKKDGKITEEEIEEGLNIAKKGIDDTLNAIQKGEKHED